jgi:small multidrug resistance family-3 protein
MGRIVSKPVSFALLLIAALMESGGDAIVRKGIAAVSWQRPAWFLAGAAVLFGYGYLVNRAPWRFGEVIGLYVVFFFVAAQAQAVLVFHESLSNRLLAGGLLIIAGGVIIASGR